MNQTVTETISDLGSALRAKKKAIEEANQEVWLFF